MKSESTMRVVSEEMVSGPVKVDETVSGSPIGSFLSSHLTGRPAQTATDRLNGSSIGKKARSRFRRPAIACRRNRRSTRGKIAPGGVVVGTLVGINDSGQPLVRNPLDPARRILLARTAVPLDVDHVDRDVVISFELGDLRKPIVLGVLHRAHSEDQNELPAAPPTIRKPIVQATMDGEQLVFTAEHEIILQCGKASLTLTRAGKVLIRGTYLLSRSSGVNRIKGGSIQLN
jgi:Domain of unknown function (DUF6484)